MLLTTFDPFSRDFDRVIERAFGRNGSAFWAGPAMPMDAVRHEDGVEFRFDLPGIDPASIEVTIDRGVLAVSAQRTEEFAEGEKPVVRERFTGSFSRRVRLGSGVDAEKVEASYDRGVLTVRVPLAETAKPRKVEIQTGEAKEIAA